MRVCTNKEHSISNTANRAGIEPSWAHKSLNRSGGWKRLKALHAILHLHLMFVNMHYPWIKPKTLSRKTKLSPAALHQQRWTRRRSRQRAGLVGRRTGCHSATVTTLGWTHRACRDVVKVEDVLGRAIVNSPGICMKSSRLFYMSLINCGIFYWWRMLFAQSRMNFSTRRTEQSQLNKKDCLGGAFMWVQWQLQQ